MPDPSVLNRARISEIFSSIQGEGVYLGQRHLFVRFQDCHLHCRYCDERGKSAVEMELGEALREIRDIDGARGPHSFISLTGGEPLLCVQFLKPLMRLLRENGFRILLETNGILWQALEAVLPWCDVIGMDMKPASVTGEKNFYREHERFLEVAATREVYIKIVLSPSIDRNEFLDFIEIIRKISPSTPVILQPESGNRESGPGDVDLDLIQDLQRTALKRIRDVRVVPRLHKILNVR